MTTPDHTAAPRWIRPLPERLINKIAAGEVVERPASVVKELVENSLDASATRIEIRIEKSGTKLIEIVDNGCGIAEEQIEIAFSRHATSKIADFHDLDSILTYGFRGEALPSIASVSRLRMVSRVPAADMAALILYEGGVLQTKQPVAGSPGTTIEVENLFYNTPARRKFLKAETTELRHISRTATALAIGNPQIAFSYTVNGRKVFACPAEQTLLDRVTSLISPGKKLIEINGGGDRVRLTGLIGLPEHAQTNRSGQYIFINGRTIQSPTLSHALVAGYGELMPRGNFPVGVLLLTVDPAEVDVNVHPAKTEVRLSHEREIHDLIYRCIKEALRQDGVIPALRMTHQGSSSPSGSGASVSPPGDNRIPGIAERAGFQSPRLFAAMGKQENDTSLLDDRIVRVDTRTGEVLDSSSPAPSLAEPPDAPSAAVDDIRLVGRFADCYLIFQRDDELLLVDQHTAHERVLYEETLRRIDREDTVSQQLLLPVTVELSPEQFAVFQEIRDWLRRSGFTVAEFGGRTVRIEAVPVILSRKSPERALRYILDDITSLKKAGSDLRKAIAQTIACRSAVMAGDRMTDREAHALVTALQRCENMYSCPHGRPTFIRISRTDLDRQFGRE